MLSCRHAGEQALTRRMGRTTFNGNTYDLRSLLPAYTFDDTISNTPVTGISGFPVGIAHSGDCLAVGG